MQQLEGNCEAVSEDAFWDVISTDAIADGFLADFKQRWQRPSTAHLPVCFHDSNDVSAGHLTTLSRYRGNEQWPVLIIANFQTDTDTLGALEDKLSFLARNVCVLVVIVNQKGLIVGEEMRVPMPKGYCRLLLRNGRSKSTTGTDILAQAYLPLLKATCEQNLICVDVVDLKYVCSRSEYLFHYCIQGADMADIANQALSAIASSAVTSVFFCINSTANVHLVDFTVLCESLEKEFHEDTLMLGTIVEHNDKSGSPNGVDFFFGAKRARGHAELYGSAKRSEKVRSSV